MKTLQGRRRERQTKCERGKHKQKRKDRYAREIKARDRKRQEDTETAGLMNDGGRRQKERDALPTATALWEGETQPDK